MDALKVVEKFGANYVLYELVGVVNSYTLDELKEFKKQYYDFLPVVDSDCVMNRISHYIESIDFEIKKRVRSSDVFDYRILQSENFMINKKIYEQIYYTVEEHIKNWQIKRKVTDTKTIQGYIAQAQSMATVLDSGNMPVKYSVDENQYVLSDITKNDINTVFYVMTRQMKME